MVVFFNSDPFRGRSIRPRVTQGTMLSPVWGPGGMTIGLNVTAHTGATSDIAVDADSLMDRDSKGSYAREWSEIL